MRSRMLMQKVCSSCCLTGSARPAAQAQGSSLIHTKEGAQSTGLADGGGSNLFCTLRQFEVAVSAMLVLALLRQMKPRQRQTQRRN